MEIKIQIFHLQPKLKHLGINLTKDVQEPALKIQNIAGGNEMEGNTMFIF